MTKQYIKRLRKYSPDFQMRMIEIISKIEVGDYSDLDIVKLSGNIEQYRCRLGKFRILFHENEAGKNIIDNIGSRGDIYK